MLTLLPPWQVLLAVAGLVFFLQHKWMFTRRILASVPIIGDGLVECSFCLGAHLGWWGWFLAAWLTGRVPSEWALDVASIAVWMFSAAGASLLLDKVSGEPS